MPLVRNLLPKLTYLDEVEIPAKIGELQKPELSAVLQVYGVRIMAVPKPKKSKKVNI
jgi:hypothetical protein